MCQRNPAVSGSFFGYNSCYHYKIYMNNQLDNLRHSCAHLLAAAVKDLYPGAHNAIGPAIENGFYQDFDLEKWSISEADLPKIEKRMREMLKDWGPFVEREVSVEQAMKDFVENPYKLELIADFAKEGKKVFENDPGHFLDLCKGGHSKNPKEELKHFKLLSIAGAYWRGSEKNKMLTRIYGTIFPNSEDLDKYIWQLQESKKRDHRKIAKELDLIVFSELVGAGLPLYTPKGAVLRSAIYNFSRKLNESIGYQETALPGFNRAELFRVSGHYEKYKADMFLVTSHYSKEEFYLKPMNCPQHCELYASRPRSYRDLPQRYSDFSVLYRDERPGEINGLLRSRAFTQDDGHCFCREDQIEEEFSNVLTVVDRALNAYGFDYRIRLSLSDPKTPEKYLGDKMVWERAEKALRKIVEDKKVKFYEGIGEAAIYGPKLDFMATDSLGREWQLSTIQLDMIMAKRFGLEYSDVDGTKKTPFMIHRAIIGSERFIAIIIEHYAGAFPLWLSPVQVKVLPISEKHLDYSQSVVSEFKKQSIRAEIDEDNKTVGYKIRQATLQKVPYMVIIGDTEVGRSKVDGGKSDEMYVSVRTREGKDEGQKSIYEFISVLKGKIEKFL